MRADRNRYNPGMSLTLLAPVSLAEAAEQLTRQRMRAPGLEALLTSATIRVNRAALDDVLAAALGIRDAGPAPAAALRLATEDVPLARDAYWLCADPVSTALLVDNAEVGGCVTDLAREEADALIAAFDAAFAADGLQFSAPDPSRWYVRCASGQQLSTTPLWRAIGNSMRDALPTGDDGPAWRARLNEAQMVLHAHSVNDAREARRQKRVDSLWWWGGGTWPEFGQARIDRVIGGPRWARAACKANAIAHVAAGSDESQWLGAGTGRILCVAADDWESAGTPDAKLAEWDERWFRPLSVALNDGRIAAATIHFGWGERTLTAECVAPKRSLLQRLLGSRAPEQPPSIEASLATVER